ncbi:hypothetical protein PR048_012344 [Dryococelus australis]|uniref:THAP-type domain-containing protein n=1 Tax=Dryococelus australis TaxID=614101 RepID=A0ABQ9HPM4_9NEOP|nr:hypothetical protein PR048_012344 [Dryococelus australis]
MPRRDTCCVPRCKYVHGAVRHTFPVYEEEEFYIWLRRIANPKFDGLDDITVYINVLVCDEHFSVHCKNAGTKKVKKFSLPTLNLPVLAECVMECNSMDHRTPDKVGHSVQHTPSTAEIQHIVSGQLSTPVTVELPKEFDRKTNETPKHSNQFVLQNTPPNDRTRPSISVQSISTAGRRRSVLKEVSVRKVSHLTPKIRKLKKKAHVLTRKCLSFKKRLSAAEKFATSKTFQALLSGLNSTSRTFVLSQQRNQKRKSNSIDSLHPKNGRGYRLLAKVFVLPSRKTMMAMLRKVPFEPGLTAHIMKYLKGSVEKLKPHDKYYTLVFDFPYRTGFTTMQVMNNKVLGFEDLGVGNRKQKLSDHAIVFMVHGIHKKWKQPVCYMLVQSAMKTIALVRFIKSIVRGLFGVGLKVIATMCDQGPANKQRSYTMQNKECQGGFFEVDFHKVVPLFDSPHLLNDMRNNLLNKDFVFIQDGKVKIASWKHDIQFFELDNWGGDDDRRMCP